LDPRKAGTVDNVANSGCHSSKEEPGLPFFPTTWQLPEWSPVQVHAPRRTRLGFAQYRRIIVEFRKSLERREVSASIYGMSLLQLFFGQTPPLGSFAAAGLGIEKCYIECVIFFTYHVTIFEKLI